MRKKIEKIDLFYIRIFRWALFFGGLLLMGIIFLFLGEDSIVSTVFTVIAMILFFSSFVVYFFFCRCRYCKWILPFGDITISYCPYCGQNLDEM